MEINSNSKSREFEKSFETCVCKSIFPIFIFKVQHLTLKKLARVVRNRTFLPKNVYVNHCPHAVPFGIQYSLSLCFPNVAFLNFYRLAPSLADFNDVSFDLSFEHVVMIFVVPEKFCNSVTGKRRLIVPSCTKVNS